MAGLRELVAEARAASSEIAPHQAKADTDAGALVLDVREPGEFAKGRIAGAVNVPRGLLEIKAAADSPVADPRLAEQRDARILVYCTKSPSARSLLAAQTLTQLGYSNVAVVEGGLDAWTEADLPTETG
jgi:rhodanese-related sulfurtransferase